MKSVQLVVEEVGCKSGAYYMNYCSSVTNLPTLVYLFTFMLISTERVSVYRKCQKCLECQGRHGKLSQRFISLNEKLLLFWHFVATECAEG